MTLQNIKESTKEKFKVFSGSGSSGVDPGGVMTPVDPAGVGVKKYFRGHDPAGVGVEKNFRGQKYFPGS